MHNQKKNGLGPLAKLNSVYVRTFLDCELQEIFFFTSLLRMNALCFIILSIHYGKYNHNIWIKIQIKYYQLRKLVNTYV